MTQPLHTRIAAFALATLVSLAMFGGIGAVADTRHAQLEQELALEAALAGPRA